MTSPDNLNSWHSIFKSFNFKDLWSVHSHSPDFRSSRTGYIFLRIRVLALMGAILSLLWIPVEYWLLPSELFPWFVGLRVVVAIALFRLSTWTVKVFNLKQVYLRLSLLVLIPSLFYLIASILLAQHGASGLLSGYEYFPLLLVTIGAIFPLTISEGIIAVAAVFGLFLGVQMLVGDLFALGILNTLWLMLLLGSIAVWTELSQLHILLRLYRQATRDPLTGLFNRRILIEQLQSELEQAKTVSVLLFDLDRFKRINDSHGHLAGDEVLRAFTKILEHQLKNRGLVGRYGGEEFLAILPHTTERQAIVLAESIRLNCHQVTVETFLHNKLSFTVSIGVTEWHHPESIESLLNRVDDFLYVAKEKGRDCIVAQSLLSEH
jgi:diguanylate cyclase (GGDEF)-like protein